jgi:hypothetical protein
MNIDEIRERHEKEAAFLTGQMGIGSMQIDMAQIHQDRGALLDHIEELKKKIGDLGDEFDMMHKTVDTRYVAERIYEILS